MTTTTDIAANIERRLLANMENINPYPQTRQDREALSEFLDFAGQYVRVIEPSEMFARRITAFLDTIQFQRQQQEQQRAPPPPRVQVTRLGSKRVFGADITHQVMQDENISAGLLQNNRHNRN
jgi:hypothetical protein